MVHSLNHTYVLWRHEERSTDWSPESYIKMGEFDTIETFWNVLNTIESLSGMFFIMKNHIPPRWEDPANSNGGCWSARLSRNNSYISVWEELSARLIGYTLVQDVNDMNLINGISLTIRKRHVIIKIWTKENLHHSKFRTIQGFHNLRYTSHKIRNT